MMNSDSDDKIDFPPSSSIVKKRPNYLKRKSSRKQAKGQSSSQILDDTQCTKSILDVFKKRRDRSPGSEYSAVEKDEPSSDSSDYNLEKANNNSIFDRYKNLKHQRSVFELRDSNDQSKYTAVDDDSSHDSDYSESDQIQLVDNRTAIYIPSLLETGDYKSDGSIHTGVTLLHSNLTRTKAHNSSILDISQRSSLRGSSMFSDNSDTHHPEANPAEGKKSGTYAPNVHSSGIHSNDSHSRTENWFNFRSWIIIILFMMSFLISCYSSLGCNILVLDVGFEPENIEWKQYIDFGPWSFSSSALREPRDSETKECLLYPSDFKQEFISTDLVWNISRSLPIISFVLHCIAFLIILLMGIKSDLIPLSKGCCQCLHLQWKKIVMILTMGILLLEGSKFGFFFNSLCKSNVWTVDFKTNTKAAAVSCEPGLGLHLCIVSMLFYFLICLILCTSPIDVQLKRRREKEIRSKNSENKNSSNYDQK